MSATVTLPTEEQAKEACAFMAAEVYAPAFFEKLATHGIAPRNRAEAEQLLQLAALLDRAESQGQYKSAADVAQEQENPFLSSVLARFEATTPQDDDDAIKEAALQAVQSDEVVKAAALVFNHVMAGGALAESEASQDASPSE